MNYVTEVADLVLELNPNLPLLNSDDYLVIAEWEKQGIPLAVVKTSLREAFRKPAIANTATTSIEPMCQTVVSNFEKWLRSPVPG